MEYVVLGLPGVLAEAETEAQVEEVPEEDGHNPVLPDTAELIWGAIAFAVLFAVLARYAFPAIGKVLEQRTDKIRGDLERAEQARQDADSLLQRYEQQLQDARSEANRIIDEARKTAESMRKDILARAEDEGRQLVSRAQEEIRAERDRALQALRGQVGAMSVTLAERIVGQALDRDRHLRLVEDYIEEVAGMGGGNGSGGGEGGAPQGGGSESGGTGGGGSGESGTGWGGGWEGGS